MAYGSSGGRNFAGGARRSFGGGSSKGAASRLTGLFATKRQGLWVGSVRAEQLDNLIGKIKAAKGEGKGITFFLWKNQQGQAPYSISADVEREAPQGRGRSIDEDDAPPQRRGPAAIEEDGDDLFGPDR